MIVHDKLQVPHWAPGAADRLHELLTGDEIAIEWGGGGSTPWLASRVKHVHVIEHSEEWAHRIMEWCAEFDNVSMHQHGYKNQVYVECPSEIEDVDSPRVWLIDGFQRIKCLYYVQKQADFGDIIVLDDALDYAEHILFEPACASLQRFAMPHPHAGIPCVSRKNKRYGNTVRKVAPDTKETWLWRV